MKVPVKVPVLNVPMLSTIGFDQEETEVVEFINFTLKVMLVIIMRRWRLKYSLKKRKPSEKREFKCHWEEKE